RCPARYRRRQARGAGDHARDLRARDHHDALRRDLRADRADHRLPARAGHRGTAAARPARRRLLMSDAFDLARFVAAQAPVIEAVRRELAAGRKQSHWMWFVFPQLRGLGRSSTALRYGISGLAEARAYLAHPVLGPRLIECTELVNGITGRSAHDIFGSPDDMKFRSSMTLFARADPAATAFRATLDVFFGGEPDRLTEDMLAAGG